MEKDFLIITSQEILFLKMPLQGIIPESVKMTYNRCKNHLGKDLHKLYMIQYPFCGREANQDRYYVIPDLPINEEIDCIHCDNIFEVSHDTTLVLYEKEKTNDRK